MMPTTDFEPDEAGAKPAASPPNKTGRAFASLKRELTDEELASPGTQKMLLEELARLENENATLQSFRDRFYNSDKQLAVSVDRLRHKLSLEIVASACLVIGAAALGYAPKAWDNQPNGWIALVFGAVLI